MGVRTFLANLALAVAAFAAPAPDPATDAAPPPGIHAIPIEPAVALRDLRRAYRETTIDQEVTIVVRARDKSSRSSALRVRTEPGGRAVLILGALTVWLDPADLVAVHREAPGRCFRAEYPKNAPWSERAKALPPLPVPQLAAALSSDDALRELTPYSRDISWRAGVLDAKAEPPTITLTGDSIDGPTTLVIDAERGWIRELSQTLDWGGTEILIRADPPMPAGETHIAVRPDLATLIAVPRLEDLRPLSSPVPTPTLPPAPSAPTTPIP